MRVGLISALADEPRPLDAPAPPPFYSFTGPYLLGVLGALGVRDCTYHDCNRDLLRHLEENRGCLELASFAEAEPVDAYLAAGGGPLAPLVDRVLSLLGLGAADLYALSFASLNADLVVAPRFVGLGLCLLAGLKRRHPASRTAIGGLHVFSRPPAEVLAELLVRSPTLDWAVEGPGDACLRWIVRRLAGEAAGDEVDVERHGEGSLLRARPEAGQTTVDLARALAPVYLGCEGYRVSGRTLCRGHRLPAAAVSALTAHLDASEVTLPYVFSEGCGGGCSFCLTGRQPFTARPPREVVGELARIQAETGATSFVFLHSCINGAPGYAEAFADELSAARLDLLWADSLRLDRLDDRQAGKLRESGLVRADVGIETAVPRLLRLHGKPGAGGEARAKLDLLHHHGIWIAGNLIVGLPGETDADVDEDIAWLDGAREVLDGVAVNRFWLHTSARMSSEAERFGVRRRAAPAAAGARHYLAFDLVDESWEVYSARTERAYARLSRAVIAAGFAIEPSFHLLFWLYRALGDKARVRLALGAQTSPPLFLRLVVTARPPRQGSVVWTIAPRAPGAAAWRTAGGFALSHGEFTSPALVEESGGLLLAALNNTSSVATLRERIAAVFAAGPLAVRFTE